ncbi:MAG: methyltransferase domain-containing protein [Methylacidiphilales bacterium]|nr:methyltransferase domain-containing protein [Candidatus Methylacidiphilales bacterium]NJR19411.1 methyltransferase domain-containing protein [Calothrix sp. CSU_2_0]
MESPAFLTESAYSHIDRAPEPMKCVQRMDEIGAGKFWGSIKSQMLELLEVNLGDRIVDIGCGAGNDSLVVAGLVGKHGRVVGIDFSNTMIAEANKRAKGLGLPVEYHFGDAQNLPFPDNNFDGCRAERLLQHLDNPQRAIAEMVRVAKPGAHVVAAEPDYGSITIKGSKPILTRKFVSSHCGYFRSPRIGMLIPLLFERLQLVDINVVVISSIVKKIGDRGEKQLINKYINLAVAKGMVSETEGKSWLEDLKRAEIAGRFQHQTTIFLVSGRKPN